MSTISRSLRRLAFPPALALPLASLAIAAATLQPVSHAAEPDAWTAGERTTVTAPATGDTATAAIAVARSIEIALGLGGAAARRVRSVDDRFHELQIAEVTYVDARERPIGLLRLGHDGRLLAAVHLGFGESLTSGSLTASAAVHRAAALLRAVGIAVPVAAPLTRRQMNGLLWTVTWPRTVDDVPVDGDGVTVRLWRSGDLHSVTVTERPLIRPVRVMPASAARQRLDAALAGLLPGGSLPAGDLVARGLHWVAANDRYRPSGADAPAAQLRLAWVFELSFSGASAEVLRAAAFWIDAETGELIGGDVLR
jgi:hypothetical protein